MITIYAKPKQQITLGHQVENESRRVAFDVTEFLTEVGLNGAFSLAVQRSSDSDAYPISSSKLSLDGNTLYWTVTSADTAVVGYGLLQLSYAISGVIAKTDVFGFKVLKSIGATATPPSPWTSYVDAVAASAQTATTKAGEASASASSASTSASTATTKASEASTSAQTASTKAGEASASATTASTASTTAVNAKNDAVSAKGDAESARDAAVTAKNAAVAAAESIPLSRIALDEKRITNLELATKGIAYTETLDDSEAYAKSVPANALQYAEMQTVGGKSVVWNQLCNFGDGNRTASANYATIAATGATVPTGHKYYASSNIKGTNGTSVWIAFSDNNLSHGANILTTSTSFVRLAILGTNDEQYTRQLRVFAMNGDTAYWERIILIDLTKMFGSGNEPTTLTDERIIAIEAYAAEHPEYNEGEIIHAITEKVVSKKTDGTEIAETAIPSAIRSLHGYGWSAGSVCNYVDFQRKKFVKCVDRVDLGSLSWSKALIQNKLRFDSSDVIGMVNDNANYAAHSTRLVCDMYIGGKSPIGANNIDKVIGTYGGRLYIRDDNYADVAVFKTAMSGVYVFYELATPIETDISSYLDDNFRYLSTEGGGTLTFAQTDTELPVPSKILFDEKVVI